MNAKKTSLYDLCSIAIFTAMIAVCAQIAIPVPFSSVPLTMQTLAIALAGAVLGAKRGALSAFVYILLGAVGVPVFAAFTGGIGIVFGYMGGFILSFPLLALVVGVTTAKNSKWWLWLGIIAGVVVNHVCGLVYFSIYMSADLRASFLACTLPFIPTDIMKILIVGFLGERLKNTLTKRRLLA